MMPYTGSAGVWYQGGMYQVVEALYSLAQGRVEFVLCRRGAD
jgi:hypothetical protein